VSLNVKRSVNNEHCKCTCAVVGFRGAQLTLSTAFTLFVVHGPFDIYIEERVDPMYLSNSADKHFSRTRSLMRTHHLKISEIAGGGSHWRSERARIRF